MDFNRFLNFLCAYALPEEKKAFFSYFEKKEQSKRLFLRLKEQTILIVFSLILFYLKDKALTNTILGGFLFILGKNTIEFRENLRIFDNLHKARISYEESSWFDLEIWEKPFFHIKYDHLLAKKQKKKIRNILANFFLIDEF